MASSSSSSRSFKYDVFLSFRGEDTRKTFVDHLYAALKLHLIGTFKDDETLPRGESIRPSLFKAIEDSRIAVIVFSKNYADSSWCLEELAHIMKCKDERELIVLPIFYDVDPSDVRKQKGDFGKAFAQQDVENTNKAQLWRNALIDASNIAGWEPKHTANGHESKVIQEIVGAIKDKLSPLNAEADEDLVGMKTRIRYLKSQLEIGSDGVRMVGIWGVGGGGKTTLASSLYMGSSCYFEGHHIVENIREKTSKYGLEKLQEIILSALSKTEVKVHSIVQGKSQMKSMLCRRKVLLVLDDVDELDQLEALAGSHSWFGSGSRIIITTRDEHLLKTHKVNEICHIELLSDDEAMQLFNKHAYNEKCIVEDYEKLSSRVVSYAAGLPLALKVLGSFLCDKEKNAWISTLDRLKDIPETKIVEKLKLSYDGLKTVEKELFLDIACFFRGEPKRWPMEILETCGFHPEIGIEVLRQKALISIVDDVIYMHDLVQEMGHYIVRAEHPNSPDKHSRIWKPEEIYNMRLTMGNEKIEAIQYYNSDHDLDSSQFCKNVSNMKKLRTLTLSMFDPELVEGPNFLSNEFCNLDWVGYPGKSPFPDSFQPMKLAVLKLDESHQKEVWKGCKDLPHLKVLELDNMWKLLRTPNFDGLPCLQNLTLRNCSMLKEIHPSLGNHKSLQYVKVSSCDKLRMFPTIVHMENLNTLEIMRCKKILEFPKIQANMEGLVKLSVKGTGILNLSYSQILELSNLQELDLSDNDFSRFDFSLSQLTRLKLLNVSRCEKLLELPELPSSLTILDASYCKSLTTLGDCHKNCRWLCQVSLKGGSIINDSDRLLASMLEMAIENRNMLLQLTGVGIAKGFTPPLLRGGRCTLQLPENWCNDFSGFLICAVFPHKYRNIMINMKEMNGMDSQHNDEIWEESDSDSVDKSTWMAYVSFGSLRQSVWWDQTHKALLFETNDYDCCGFGVRLIEKKSTSGLTETSTINSSGYAPNLKIEYDSMSALSIYLRMR